MKNDLDSPRVQEEATEQHERYSEWRGNGVSHGHRWRYGRYHVSLQREQKIVLVAEFIWKTRIQYLIVIVIEHFCFFISIFWFFPHPPFFVYTI